MTRQTKFISLVLLVAFFGLLTLGTVVDKPTNLSQHSDGVDCFGVGCGPVEHVVLHNYLVAEVVGEIKNDESRQQTLVENNSIPQNNFIVPETPPPTPHLSLT